MQVQVARLRCWVKGICYTVLPSCKGHVQEDMGFNFTQVMEMQVLIAR